MSDDPTPEEFADPANWHPIEEHPYLNDPPKVTMPDTLRDRIAAALKAADKRVAGFISYEERADAVISALGLQLQPAKGHHRYVTEWEPDETD